MQKFEFLRQPFLGELAISRKKGTYLVLELKDKLVIKKLHNVIQWITNCHFVGLMWKYKFKTFY